MVKIAWRGRGIGAKLMEEIEDNWPTERMLLYHVRVRRP